MDYKRILTIQDISCVGQCSLTVALPILSVCGLETAILPSAVLSTHTAGFKNYTFRDLTEDIPAIGNHWKQENIQFSAVYTGYLGSTRQVEMVKEICNTCLIPEGKILVDPAMADNGKLYPGFDESFVTAMANLVFSADIILPNITEAALLTGKEYKEIYDAPYIESLLSELHRRGAKTVVLTGVSYDETSTGVVVSKNGHSDYYRHEKLEGGCHGTGDVYASAFVGAYMQGKEDFESAKIAADYTVDCIKATQGDRTHWYGVKFEPLLSALAERLKQ